MLRPRRQRWGDDDRAVGRQVAKDTARFGGAALASFGATSLVRRGAARILKKAPKSWAGRKLTRLKAAGRLAGVRYGRAGKIGAALAPFVLVDQAIGAAVGGPIAAKSARETRALAPRVGVDPGKLRTPRFAQFVPMPSSYELAYRRLKARRGR